MSGRSRPATLVVLVAAMLLSSGTVGVALADSPSTADVQSTEDDDVVDAFFERMSAVETVEFDRTIVSTYDNETTMANASVAVDFEDGQKRVDLPEQNVTTVVNGTELVTYDADENTVTDFDRNDLSLLPRLEQLSNRSVASYEHTGTETVDGRTTYVLEGTPKQQSAGDVNGSLTVYVDTETYFPVRIATETSTENYDIDMTVTYRNVDLDEGIPDSTFDLDVPEDATNPADGYTIDAENFDSRDALASSTDLSVPDAELGDGFSFERGTVVYGDDHDRVRMTYADGERTVSLSLHDPSVSTARNTDSDRYEEVGIGDATGYLHTSDEYDFASLQWESDQFYGVYGSVTQETVIGIGESIEN